MTRGLGVCVLLSLALCNCLDDTFHASVLRTFLSCLAENADTHVNIYIFSFCMTTV